MAFMAFVITAFSLGRDATSGYSTQRDSFLSQFTEDFFFIPFITCDNLKAAMTRGFASWSDNSVYVSFTDVTAECEKIGQLNEDCPLAEIWDVALTVSISSETCNFASDGDCAPRAKNASSLQRRKAAQPTLHSNCFDSNADERQ